MEQESLLEENEIIIEKVRKHWIVYVSDFFIHSIGCLLFIALAYGLTRAGQGMWIPDQLVSSGSLTLFAFVSLFWISFFFFWTKNYFDVWYITNQHIIAVNQKQLFERDEAFMELTRIQDVFFEKNGFISTFLGYGQLKVQSAGTVQEFIIEDVADVEHVAHRIMELRDASQEKAPLSGV
jgi:membrane protein YdbS with pleckstrin-like domain